MLFGVGSCYQNGHRFLEAVFPFGWPKNLCFQQLTTVTQPVVMDPRRERHGNDRRPIGIAGLR
jgi:hypothetical protein